MVNVLEENATELLLLFYPEMVAEAQYHSIWSQADLSSSAGSDIYYNGTLSKLLLTF